MLVFLAEHEAARSIINPLFHSYSENHLAILQRSGGHWREVSKSVRYMD